MAISETNLKLLKAERNTDFADGGGKMTSVEVVDGQVNNVFNDISQLDRTYGRISLRKAYATVQTANTDTYLGSHIILTDPPDDPHVNVTLFTTESWTDERDASRSQIESYSIQGPEVAWNLYGDHIVGQKMLVLFSRSNSTAVTTPTTDIAPQVGDIMLLSVEKTGFTAVQQYVRITKINSRITSQFNDSAGAYYKDVLTIEIGNPLRYLFNGASAPTRNTLTRNDTASSPTVFRMTQVADAANYFGVKKLTQAMAINDMTATVDSPYSALVPSAQAETPLVDVNASMARPNYVQAGTLPLSRSATLTGSVSPDYAASLYMSRGILPGSLVLDIGGVLYKDANGVIVLSTGAVGSYGGSVDYASGQINITKTTSWTATVTATVTRAVVVYDNAGTTSIPITINNRAFNYVQTLSPTPTPGSLIIDYKALDKWYRLYDDGLGHVNGGSVTGIGAGTINYATGSVSVTLAALPDVDSSVIFAWTTPLDYTMQTYVAQPKKPAFSGTLLNVPIEPGTLSITWTDGVLRTIWAQGNGQLYGYGTGKVVHATGELYFEPQVIPTSGTVFTITYSQSLAKQDTFFVTGDAGGVVNFTLTQTPVKPASVRLGLQVFDPSGKAIQVEYHDNGAGAFHDKDGSLLSGTNTINYATGAITVDLTQTVPYNYPFMSLIYNGAGVYTGMSKTVITSSTGTTGLAVNTALIAKYSLDSAVPVAKTETVSLTQLVLDLSTQTSEALVAGSISFGFAGASYIDRQGLLYRNHVVTTDAATASGTIDYQSGIATITQWPGGTNTLTMGGAVSIKGQSYVVAASGRTPGAPLSVGQFTLNLVSSTGLVISASVNNNGDFSHEWVHGHIDWLSGVFNVIFGKLVLDSSLTTAEKTLEGWYNAANVDGTGHIWRPLYVKPETLKFNAVLVSYIPLDADILGVETVRLPQDGRVPIYRVGNVAVVHNTQILTLPNPVVASSVHDCGRTLLSYAKVFDANGLVIPTAKYTTNLDAGTVTMAAALDLTGFVQPLHIEHRIEDMALVTDVQITGQVKLMKPVRHAYPANTSFLSSALVIGDLQARVTNQFDQQTWASTFSNILSGSAATASFNSVLYPTVVTNAGTIQERWALVFTGATTFNCFGEYSGLVASGTTGVDFSPLNPITNVPYFVIDYRGWGTGWSAGNVLRFNTVAANYPLWMARTTLQSAPTVYTDNFKLQIRGDSN